MAELNLPLYSYQIRSRPASTARLINCYPELMPAGGRSRVLLRRSPGAAAFTTVGSGPIVATHKASIDFGDGNGARELLYVASGSEFYYVTEDGTATKIGDIGTPVRVDIDSDDDNVVIINQPKGWVWDGTSFTEIDDSDFVDRGAGDVEYLETFMVYRQPDSNIIFAADTGDPSSIRGLAFAAADQFSDTLIGIRTDQRQLIAFGTESTEFYENIGDPIFPLARIVNGTLEVGLLAAGLVARAFDQIYFVADDRTVRRIEGLSAPRISTIAVEQFLSSLTNEQIERGRSWGYTIEGHFFFGMQFETGTWVFDAGTGEWHERRSYGRQNWRWSNCLECFNKILAFDTDSNRVSEIDPETYTDNQTPNLQVMQWTYQPVYADGIRAFHNYFELEMGVGVGQANGDFTDPKVTLEFSDDSGLTWHKAPLRSLGQRGKYRQRVTWHNLGSSEERVYRVTISDPIPVVVTKTLIDVDGGRLT